MYPADAPFPVYSTESWWSDKWDARNFAQDIDFSRPFFEQLHELYLQVPRLQNVGSSDMKKMNSEYVNYAGWNKNCYLIFDSDYNEECCYSNVIKHSKYCLDCSYVSQSQFCHDCVDCSNSYELKSCQRCNNCSNSSYLFNCIGCQNCAFCCNLTNQKYCLWNKQLTKDEYHNNLNEIIQSGTPEEITKQFAEFTLTYPRKYCSILQSEDCSGDYISNAQRCTTCFNVGDAQDLQYCDSVYRAKDCMDVSSFGEKIERVSNSGTIGHGCFGVHFSYDCVTSCSDLFYCLQCHQTKNSFGCVGFRSGNYCILNKQYTKEDYDELVPKIVKHMQSTEEWGEYFPVRMSPFAYNETVAQEYFPMTKEEVLARNWKWRDATDDIPKVEKTIPAAQLPHSIQNIPDDILNWAITCETTGRPFLVTKQELSFYRNIQIPVPHFHPDERHRKRIALRNPRKLWKRKCDTCGKDIQSTYDPDRHETVYCEECYLKEMY
ncbi:hypothetical protein COU78_00175 [Candidatus Peregrinibacteria bacterium CG10_big_fil_rev_8_21_14_0_10_49_24]|nr:MAG: hypothetical protein COU78_00175 [Candidatus Peregrinibacteria bacterium CG10_big_fil_rev_8_21_14_0_10_49_24]